MSYYPSDRPPQHGPPKTFTDILLSLLGIASLFGFAMLATEIGFLAAVAVAAVVIGLIIAARRRFDI